MDEGAIIDVHIERILPGGVGLAHAEGRTVFVWLAAPGDELRIRIDRIRGKLAFASIKEVLKASPVRVAAPCPYFGRCGGCDFQQLTYEAQLQAKSDIIRDCLRRIAHIREVPELSVMPAPQPWEYRARANWQVDHNTPGIGYYERGSHTVCDVSFCAILVPELQMTLEQVRNEAQNIFADDVEAAAGDHGVSVSPEIGTLKTREVTRSVGVDRYRFDATSFFQINHTMLGPLVLAAIGDASGRNAVDLYSGVGLFTLPLARRFSQVVAVEGNSRACRYAIQNINDAGLTNVEVINRRVDDWLRDSTISDPIDLILLDPPRSGAEPEVIEGLLIARPTQIVYVSCDPSTLARDLKALLAGDYRLDSLAAFDMFPQTHHVETVVHLKRDG